MIRIPTRNKLLPVTLYQQETNRCMIHIPLNGKRTAALHRIPTRNELLSGTAYQQEMNWCYDIMYQQKINGFHDIMYEQKNQLFSGTSNKQTIPRNRVPATNQHQHLYTNKNWMNGCQELYADKNQTVASYRIPVRKLLPVTVYQ